MNELEQLKSVMGDLQKRKAVLSKQAQEFHALQNEIAELRQRASHDQDAAKKIERLNEVMNNGGASMTDTIFENIGKAERCLQAVNNEFNTLVADVPPSPINPQRQGISVKKPNRAFV